MQNIIMPKVIKNTLKIFMLCVACLQIAYLFFALRDLPFMLSFPDYIKDKKNYYIFSPHFDYYIREDRHSPFLIMQERYLDLAQSGMHSIRHDKGHRRARDIYDVVINYYQYEFQQTPENGHIAYLLAKAYFYKGEYKVAADYLLKSYKLYPISGRLASARHRLSFSLLYYFSEDIMHYRQQDYKIMHDIIKRK